LYFGGLFDLHARIIHAVAVRGESSKFFSLVLNEVKLFEQKSGAKSRSLVAAGDIDEIREARLLWSAHNLIPTSVPGLAGTYQVEQLPGDPMSGDLTLSPDGTITGSIKPSDVETCTITGSIQDFPDYQHNMFKLALVLADCALAGNFEGAAMADPAWDQNKRPTPQKASVFILVHNPDTAAFWLELVPQDR
jgi:hypothetical protein